MVTDESESTPVAETATFPILRECTTGEDADTQNPPGGRRGAATSDMSVPDV